MQIVLLLTALSVDVFLASVACGAEQIHIGHKTALCISIICSMVLFFSLAIGRRLEGWGNPVYADYCAAVLFFVIGAEKLLEYGVRAYIRKYQFVCRQIRVRFSELSIILRIYSNPVMADRDRSSSMSVAEGVFFALAMSADGFLGGLGAGMSADGFFGGLGSGMSADKIFGVGGAGAAFGLLLLANLALGYAAVYAGCLLGGCAAAKRGWDLSWAGGVLFVLLACSKIPLAI